MAQAAGHQIHGDCLSCATCGNTLRNVGHHFIDNKFYCEIHGRQKKGLAPITLDPNLAVWVSFFCYFLLSKILEGKWAI